MPTTPAERLRAAAEASQAQPRLPCRRGRPRHEKKVVLVLPSRHTPPPAPRPPAAPAPAARADLEARAALLRRELATITRELDHLTAALAELPA